MTYHCYAVDQFAVPSSLHLIRYWQLLLVDNNSVCILVCITVGEGRWAKLCYSLQFTGYSSTCIYVFFPYIRKFNSYFQLF